MNSNPVPTSLADLSELLEQATRGSLADTEFLGEAKRLGVSPDWVLAQMERLHTDWDESRLCLLIDCLYLPGIHGAEGWEGVTSILCRLMLDARIEPGTVELAADAVADFRLTLQDLSVLAQVCTSPRWNDDGYWPDLRKALEAMPAAVRNGSASRQDVLVLLSGIAGSPATQADEGGLRSTANAMIRAMDRKDGGLGGG